MALAGVVLAAIALPARASDPQTYSVTIAGSGDSKLDSALTDASQLEALKDKAPVGPFALVTRAKSDIDRLQTTLQSFGYYQSKVGITIDGRSVDDSGLVDRLSAVPAGQAVEVAVAIDKGPLFRLRKIEIHGDIPPDVRGQLGIDPGQPAVASDILAAGTRLLTALEEDGYALAKVDPPVATEDAGAQAIDVVFNAGAGRQARIGPIVFTGLHDVNEDFVRRRLLLQPGQLYQPSKIDAARQDFLTLGVFSGVSVHAGEQIGSDGRLPVTFDFQERLIHAVGITGAYSTDLGASAKLTWSHRNLFGNAEQVNLSAAATGLGGTATKGVGYDVTAQFIKPDFLQRDQSLEFDSAVLKQDLQAYNQQAVTAGPSLHRKFSPLWSGSIGVSGERERILQEQVSSNFTLISLPLTANYDSTGLTDPTLDPTHGIRAAFIATPTESLGHPTATFAILQVSGSTYVDLDDLWQSEAGRSVLAFRGLVGSVEGASQFELPPDQRFYGGGSATIRGFKYQSAGPLFPDRNPMGGTAIDAATVEYRQRFFESFGAAVFVDGGQVSTGNMPFSGTVRIGTGVGLRYYTPVGPIRLDVALPVNRPPGGDQFDFYIGLGQAF
ncbi:MAG TPA: BamA/TamA family outer membrane protein [Stellaceae bacterium]|jgi:translocation and assembly module TamA|nr:BamA/TamA family outer membrane protein [Stellaceae bacterium]